MAPKRDRPGTKAPPRRHQGAARPAARPHRAPDKTGRNGGRMSRRKRRPAEEEGQAPRQKLMDLERVGRVLGGARGASRGAPPHGISRRRRLRGAGGRTAVTAEGGARQAEVEAMVGRGALRGKWWDDGGLTLQPGGQLSSCVLVHALRFGCRVRTVLLCQRTHFLAHVSLCVPKIGFSGTAGP